MKRCLNCMEEYEEIAKHCSFCGYLSEQELGVWLTPGTILQGRYITGTCRYHKDSDILYIGWDALFFRRVYIQEFFPQSCAGRDGEQNVIIYDSTKELFEAGLQIFIRDGKILITLDDTPGLVNVLSVFEENHTAYMILEYAGEIMLSDKLRRKGILAEKEVLHLMEELAVPLEKAHSSSVFHGQISPDCCFIAEKGAYRLGCFQEARYLCGEQKADGEYLGHPGSQSDVYGLASLAGILLVGQEKWENSTGEERSALIDQRCSAVSADVLKRSLDMNPSLRPESVGVFISQLTEEEKTLRFKSRTREGRTTASRRLLWLISTVLIFLLAASGIFLIKGENVTTTEANGISGLETEIEIETGSEKRLYNKITESGETDVIKATNGIKESKEVNTVKEPETASETSSVTAETIGTGEH